MTRNKAHGAGNLIVGLGLISLGGLFLLAQLLHINLMRYAWPFFIIVPGLLFFVAMVLGGKGAGALAIPGSLITMVGLLLLYQNTFNHFESWAYAWALVFPTAVGIGLMVDGVWRGQPRTVDEGKGWVKVGLIIFLIAGVFFELIVGISPRPIGRVAWALVLVGLGAYLLLRQALAAPPRDAAARPAARQDGGDNASQDAAKGGPAG